MPKTLTIGIAQLAATIGTADLDPRRANLDRAVAAIRRCAARGAQLIAIGEAYLTGYRTDEHLVRYAVRLDPPDEYVRALELLSAELDLHLIMGAATRGIADPDHVYNSALVVGPAGLIGVYHKVHLANIVFADDRAMNEMKHFTRGREIPVFETPLGTFGIHICRDNRYPEMARIQTLKGAQVLINVTAPDPAFVKFWDAATYVRAMENQVWYVMAAVVGPQRDDNYFGGSRVIDPDGEIVAQAATNQEDELVCTIDLGRVTVARERGRVLDYRAPELYGAITRVAATV